MNPELVTRRGQLHHPNHPCPAPRKDPKMSTVLDTRRARVGGGARWFVRLLVLLLVPAVTLASTGAAEAATNSNPWHTANIKMELSPAAADIACSVSSRYQVNGYGVDWVAAPCWSGIDSGIPGGKANPPEAGTHVRLTFAGSRAGAIGTPLPNVSSGQCGQGNLTGGKVTLFSGSPCLTNPTVNSNDAVLFEFGGNYGFAMRTADFIAEGGNAADPTFANNHAINTAYRASINYPTTKDSEDYTLIRTTCAGACGPGYSVVGTWTVPRFGTTLPAASSEAGAGAGDACEATWSGDMGASSKDTFSHNAGTIPAGTLNIPEDGKGFCLVTSVCVSFYFDDLFGGGHWSDRACKSQEYGTPVADATAGTDPASPVPDQPVADHPTVTTETNWWDAVLSAFAGLFDLLGRLIKAVLSIPGKILDGLSALFVPSSGFMDSEGARLTDTVQDSNLNAWNTRWDEGFNAALPGGATAAKTTTEGITTTTSSSGGGSWGDETWGAGCAGPGFTWDKFATVGMDPHWHPIAACEGTMAKVAMWTKRLATVGVVLGSMLKILQMLTVAAGASRNINALNFDWGDAAQNRVRG